MIWASPIATCESIALGDKLGVDRQKLFDVLSTSSGALDSKQLFSCPRCWPQTPADNKYIPGFAAEMMVKICTPARGSRRCRCRYPDGRGRACPIRDLWKMKMLGRDFSAMFPVFRSRPQLFVTKPAIPRQGQEDDPPRYQPFPSLNLLIFHKIFASG